MSGFGVWASLHTYFAELDLLHGDGDAVQVGTGPTAVYILHYMNTLQCIYILHCLYTLQYIKYIHGTHFYIIQYTWSENSTDMYYCIKI